MRKLLLPSLLTFAVACTSAQNQDELIPQHDTSSQVRGIQREGGSGPYVTGTTETFRLSLDGEAQAISWSASAGTLNSSWDKATWKLPASGIATLSATVRSADGSEKTVSWNFQVEDAQSPYATAREALLAAPVNLLDAGTEITGTECAIEYDTGNNVHLAFTNDTHPSLTYGLWNGSTWNLQLVDGMGFNNGGQVTGQIRMVLDTSTTPATPHLVYQLFGQGLWYATKSGGSWIRERVDNTTDPLYTSLSAAIALNPAQGKRPTIVYTSYVGSYRNVVAVRTAANTWTTTRISVGAPTSQYVTGDAQFNSAGTLFFPFTYGYLMSWDGTTATAYNFSQSSTWSPEWTNMVWSGANKLLLRGARSVVEITVANPVTSSTNTVSIVEQSDTNNGDLAYGTKPVMLHHHGTNLELVTTNAQNFWTYTQLGTATAASNPGIALSSTGVASICYQSEAKRIMFQ